MPDPGTVEPWTEAGKALYRKSGTIFTHDVIRAIEEQAATEARRELLAALRTEITAAAQRTGLYAPDGHHDEFYAAVLRLIEGVTP